MLSPRLATTFQRFPRQAGTFPISAVAQTRARVQETREGQATTSGRSDDLQHFQNHRRNGRLGQEHIPAATHAATSRRAGRGASQGDVTRLQHHTDSVPVKLPASDTAPEEDGDGASLTTKVAIGAAPLALALGILALLGGGYAFKDQISVFVDYFIQLVEEWGPGGFVAYGVVYTLLEVLALPAIPLTMTAGVIFGVVPGTAIVSVSATVAAAISFVIARYLARDKVAAFAAKNSKFKAIDAAIGRNGFKVVTLLRMSPLLPLAASSYLYGLTSVDLPSYVLGSWLGMLPGTVAYVAAGSYGRALLGGEGEGLGVPMWQLALGTGVTALSLLYIGRLAAAAVKAEEDKAAEDP